MNRVHLTERDTLSTDGSCTAAEIPVSIATATAAMMKMILAQFQVPTVKSLIVLFMLCNSACRKKI